MASKILITPEQYVAARYEREPEYVHGEIMERSLPNHSHGSLLVRLGAILLRVGNCCADVRMRLAEDLYRLPDLALFIEPPTELVPSSPPLLVVEINSPDDRMLDILQKLAEYRVWGVEHIWIVEPELKKFYRYTGGLREVDHFELPEFNLSITPEQLFS